jgi:hypothetical protein
MTNNYELTIDEMCELGARNGRVLAATLTSLVPSGATDEQVDSMFQIVMCGIEETVEKLIAGGVSETLALAYRTACYEAIAHAMRRYSRSVGAPPETTQKRTNIAQTRVRGG